MCPTRENGLGGHWMVVAKARCVLSAPASRMESLAGRGVHIISVSMAAGAGEGRGADGAEGCGAGPA